jgi:hypothetical protein
MLLLGLLFSAFITLALSCETGKTFYIVDGSSPAGLLVKLNSICH